ncbi:MAG: phosphoribosylglycinamide formyltransferase [Phycisphaeraceae bacterium]
MSEKTLRLAVLLSGGGRTLENIAQAIDRGELDARIVAVISSKADAYGVIRAKNLGLPVHVVVRKDYPSPQMFSEPIWTILREAGADLVCLCGFLSLITIPDEYAQRMLNIHPALLPAFGGKGMYGHHVHEAVLAAGCKVSGCTVHFCDQQYDTGPIIVQRACPVRENDTAETLADRVFDEECRAYVHAIRLIQQGRVVIEGRRTRITPTPQNYIG